MSPTTVDDNKETLIVLILILILILNFNTYIINNKIKFIT